MRNRSSNIVALLIAVTALLGAEPAQAQLFTGPPALLFFNGSADAMTAGPDGNAWFVDRLGNAVGRLTPASDFTRFPVPTPNAHPVDIESGPDGNLWFAEAVGKIGRITPQGTITEFPVPGAQIPDPGSNSNSLAFGADGNVWFIAQPSGSTSYSLGKMKLDGTFLGLVPMGAGVQPIKIAIGPGGAIWFRDVKANSVGSITPDGTVQVYTFTSPDPFKLFVSGSMTLGPDGNLWTSHANALARVTVAGLITEYPVTGAEIGGVTTGGDGNIWFADYKNGQIGRLIVSTATDQGTATIDQTSTAVAFQPGQLILLPPPGPLAKTGTVTPDIILCSGLTFITNQTGLSGGTTGALVLNTTAAPNTCADLSVTFGGISQAHRTGGGSLNWSISNAGPNPAVPFVEATAQTFDAYLGHASIFIHGKETPCSKNFEEEGASGTATCQPTDALSKGESATVVMVFLQQGGRLAGVPQASATMTVGSATPDPVPSNNKAAGYANFDALTPAVLPPSDSPVVPGVVQRH